MAEPCRAPAGSATNARRAAALELLQATPIWPWNYAPPGLRFLWRLGIDCPPPHMARFGHVLVITGVGLAVGMAAVQWALAPQADGALARIALGASVAGLVFGVSMATYYAVTRRRHRLPLWHEIDVPGSAPPPRCGHAGPP